ncbi:MAG: dihydropteroate synthase [Dehalococcoidia bacterium]|nr:dihydropteroate synthase [Dehalococcoidia bacterium]
MPISSGTMRCGGAVFEWGRRTYVMGILNITPDSFSGDGLADHVEAAVAQAMRSVAEGADILDIGGESTRPGHAPVGVDEELRRVVPVVAAVRRAVSVPISIDSSKAPVVEAALDAGADMVNDQWGLLLDPALGRLAARRAVPIILMHNQTGAEYRDMLPDIVNSLARSCELALIAGVAQENIVVDPGFGFGKTWEQNLEVLRRLDELRALGRPILIGTSRKSMIGRVLDLPLDQRIEGTAATVAVGIVKGADIVRVHDVLAMARVARMTDAIVRTAPA